MAYENSMNSTPASERIHIGFFGMRNAGKSSLVNAILGQQLSIVSDIKGTTTDPVLKAMELLPLGPVMIMDTPGLDDEGTLGELRIKKTKQILNKTDLAILVVDATIGFRSQDEELLQQIRQKNLPYLIVINKCDLSSKKLDMDSSLQEHMIYVSAKNVEQIRALKDTIATFYKPAENQARIVADLIEPSDLVVLVVPIDKAAPKGRLIMPQQQTIRDILDSHATAIVVQDNELKNTLAMLAKKPKLVITDSQVFGKVSKDTPDDILLTSFSILFARYKGNLATQVKGAKALDQLNDGDTILIAEGCSHHRQCGDIGTEKLPRWIREYTKKEVQFEFTSGTEYPEDLTKYQLVVHCGGCTLNEREMKYRIANTVDQGVPITNYGVIIAYMHGILTRSVEAFPAIAAELK